MNLGKDLGHNGYKILQGIQRKGTNLHFKWMDISHIYWMTGVLDRTDTLGSFIRHLNFWLDFLFQLEKNLGFENQLLWLYWSNYPLSPNDIQFAIHQ